MKDITFHILSILLLVLFFWVIYPVKWIKRLIFEVRKSNAIREAEDLSLKHNKQAYVVQYKMKFAVGLRSQFRQQNSKVRRKLADEMNGYLDYDYRNAIVYKTK